MRRNETKDDKYLDWIRGQPCVLCGWVPKGNYPGGGPKRNAAHHVSGKHNDHNTVPLCDGFLDQTSRNCHKSLVHQNMRRYRPLLEPIARSLREKYLKEVGL